MYAIPTIIFISIAIFVLVYIGSGKNKFTKATLALCLAEVIGFVGPFLVNNLQESNTAQQTTTTSITVSTPHEHKTTTKVKENILTAKCLDAGSYELVSYCDCGEELNREKKSIHPLNHNYIKHVTKPSCTEPGFTTYKCSRCQDSYVDNHTKALDHVFVDGICSLCETVSPDYESLISSQANEFLRLGNYDDALSLIEDALKLIESESLQQLYEKISASKQEAAVYTANTVEFITYSDSITGNNETDTYLLTAQLSGTYRFNLSEMVNGFEVSLYVYDSANNKIGWDNGLENNQGITCVLEKDQTYSINVMSYSCTGNYVLTVGQPKSAIDITSKKIIYDSIEYKGQKNIYTITPAISGIYRFDLNDMVNGFEVALHVYDSLKYNIAGSGGLENTNGITAEMTAGKNYTIIISEYSNLGSYTLMIGQPQSTKDITDENIFSGDITYTNQNDQYTYTPASSGKYKFTLQNMMNDFEVTLYVYDSLGYKVGGYSGAENENVIDAELEAGKEYTIQLKQYSGYGHYEVTISR